MGLEKGNRAEMNYVASNLNPISDTNQFSNPDFGIKYNAPLGWKLTESTVAPNHSSFFARFAIDSKLPELSALDFSSITLSVTNSSIASKGGTNSTNGKENFDFLLRGETECKVSEKLSEQINSIQYIVQVVDCNSFKYKVYHSVLNDSLLTVAYSGRISAYPVKVNEFDKSLQSLVIKTK
jgi:hypothetical protein